MTKHVMLMAAITVGCGTQTPGVQHPTDAGEERAVTAVIVGVVHHIDARQWGPLRALYADEVETDYTSLFGGEIQRQPGDSLIGAWKNLLTPVVTQHLLGPVHVEVRGEEATARCHVRGYHFASTAASGPTWMVAGHYVFRLRHIAGTWQITHMTLETFYQTGNEQLLQEAAATGQGTQEQSNAS